MTNENLKKAKEIIKGCGKFVKCELKWDSDEGWICGEYYPSLKKIFLCPKCKQDLAKIPVGCGSENLSFMIICGKCGVLCPYCEEIKKIKEKYYE